MKRKFSIDFNLFTFFYWEEGFWLKVCTFTFDWESRGLLSIHFSHDEGWSIDLFWIQIYGVYDSERKKWFPSNYWKDRKEFLDDLEASNIEKEREKGLKEREEILGRIRYNEP